MHLGVRTYDRLLRLIPELYACRTPIELLKDSIAILGPLIPSDGCGWFVFGVNGGPTLTMSAESDPGATTSMPPERQAEAAAAHPLNSMWQGQKRPSTLQTVDVESKRLQRYLSEFWDVYRVIGRSTMTTPISIVGETSVLAYRRGNKPFSEEHRLIADLLQPHLGRALSNARAFSALAQQRLEETIVGADALSTRESQVAFWLSRSKANREIALILKMRVRTVEKHVEHILRKLCVENRVTAALRIASSIRRSETHVLS